MATIRSNDVGGDGGGRLTMNRIQQAKAIEDAVMDALVIHGVTTIGGSNHPSLESPSD
jgi:hypothetical protein